MPRKLQLGRPAPVPAPRSYPGRPLGAPPSPLPGHKTATSLAPAPPAPRPAARPGLSARDLVDEVGEEALGSEPAAQAPVARPAPAPAAHLSQSRPRPRPPRWPRRPLRPRRPRRLLRPRPRRPLPLPRPRRPFQRPACSRWRPGGQRPACSSIPRRSRCSTPLGRNLTLAALDGKLDPVVGRAREVEEVIDILGKRRTNNPCLVGEPGVGKTAVVEGVAQRLLALRGALARSDRRRAGHGHAGGRHPAARLLLGEAQRRSRTR